MLRIKSAESQSELLGILTLQKANLYQILSEEEKASQGFVTVNHTYEQLRGMNDIAAHVIAEDEKQVTGYILAMTKDSRTRIPILVPMFEQFDRLSFRGKKISDSDYMVVGQICIDKAYRGKGLFDQMYEVYRQTFSKTYDFAITEIATSNIRSLLAHRRVGFETIHRFHDSTQEWDIVLWDWSDRTSR